MGREIFSPAFGNRPSYLVGRDQLLDRLLTGLSSTPGSRDRSVVMLGQRGSGKLFYCGNWPSLRRSMVMWSLPPRWRLRV